MSDVFLSYKREDRDTAGRIVQQLEAAGFSVWWDQHLLPGQTYRQVIATELKSASCVVVLLSKLSVEAPYVMGEASSAKDRLVPIFIENVELPYEFSNLQAADLSAWTGDSSDPEFAKVCEGIQSLLKTPRRPAAASIVHAPPPVPSPQFVLGRWRVEGVGAASDLTYFPDGTFSGFITVNVNGYFNQVNAFGRWNIQVMGPNLLQLQLWFANMSTWAGVLQILDMNRMQNVQTQHIVSRVR
jgi:hypothetical protein